MPDKPDDLVDKMPDSLQEHIPYRLGMLTNLIRQATTDSYVRQSEISGREWRVLAMIGLAGPVQARRVVELTGMDKATITRAVTRLAKLGLVAQNPAPEDKRAKLLQLTDEGAVFCDRIIPQMLHGGAELAACLTDRERKTFLTCLDKLAAKAGHMLSDL